MKIEKERIQWIDLMESIAIYFVLFYHDKIYSIDILSSQATFQMYILYYVQTILATCVPLFLFVNGFLMFKKDFNLKKHLFKLIKLIILAYIWGSITLLFYMVLKNESFTLIEFILALVTWKQGYINHIWYIGALVCIYILFPLLKTVYDNNRKIFIYFVIICVLMTFGNTVLNELRTVLNVVILHNNSVSYNVNYFSIFNLFRGIRGYTFVYFCLGGLANMYFDRISNSFLLKHQWIPLLTILFNCLGLFCVGVIYSKGSGSVWDVVWNGYDSIFTLANVLCIFILCLNYRSNNYLITQVSMNTLGIYFIHLLIISLAKPYFSKMHIPCNIFINILYTLSVLYLSLGLTLCLKKIPLLKKLVE